MWKLVSEKSGRELKKGDEVFTFRDERCQIEGLQPPHKSSSQGKVNIRKLAVERHGRDVYASVIGAKWHWIPRFDGDEPTY